MLLLRWFLGLNVPSNAISYLNVCLFVVLLSPSRFWCKGPAVAPNDPFASKTPFCSTEPVCPFPSWIFAICSYAAIASDILLSMTYSGSRPIHMILLRTKCITFRVSLEYIFLSDHGSIIVGSLRFCHRFLLLSKIAFVASAADISHIWLFI
jgi:hypothetical protein